MCLKMRPFQTDRTDYPRFQNTERLVCDECTKEIQHQLRPNWQIIGKRIFPKRHYGV